ncbi:CRISPR-associated protein Cas5 [Edaphobacter aggregans]|uniref:CRISPR-associated protein Cas5 n=1 Tax=Edaphobacter aggregans TaxID=570835 RepID=UPI001FE1982E|nr:CRISPR-associated protein Cas5 [Edaphobacter aggregans]
MPNVHGIEFNANQSELVKDLIRELLKDGGCAVYALPHMKPGGELRMALTPPIPGPRRARGVFLRVRPGAKEAIIVRPMNAKAGEQNMPVTKLTQAQNLEIIRIWRKQTRPRDVPSGKTEPGSQKLLAADLVEAAPLR